MDSNELTTWIVFGLLPVLGGWLTIYFKVSKNKQDQENRITTLEAEVRRHTKEINNHEEELKETRSELKILSKVENQNELMMDMLKELRDDIKKYKE